jgi:hypothetical protein
MIDGMPLTVADMEAGFREIGRKARAAGDLIEIAVYGGAAIVLAFDFRRATRDVDVVVKGDAGPLRRYAREVAQERGWDPDWMNDAVKGFISARAAAGLRVFRTYPDADRPGLRVLTPTPEYLLAMKCLAMRIDPADDSQDLADIRSLMRETGLTTEAALIETIEAFYPARLITPRVAFGVRQIAQEYGSGPNDVPPPPKPRRGRRRR